MKDGKFEVGNTMVWMGLKNERQARRHPQRPLERREAVRGVVLRRRRRRNAVSLHPAEAVRQPGPGVERAEPEGDRGRADAPRGRGSASRRSGPQGRAAAAAASPAAAASRAVVVRRDGDRGEGQGGWSVSIDGAESQSGRSPAATLVVHGRRARRHAGEHGLPGQGGHRAVADAAVQGHRADQEAAAGHLHRQGRRRPRRTRRPHKTNCETTFSIVADDKIDFFVEGDFGKERRVRVSGHGGRSAGRHLRRVLRAAVRLQVRRRHQAVRELAHGAGRRRRVQHEARPATRACSPRSSSTSGSAARASSAPASACGTSPTATRWRRRGTSSSARRCGRPARTNRTSCTSS